MNIRNTLDDLAAEATLCEKRGDLKRALILWAAHERVEAEYIREQSRTTGVYDVWPPLSAEALDRLGEILASPPPDPSNALIQLMRRSKRSAA